MIINDDDNNNASTELQMLIAQEERCRPSRCVKNDCRSEVDWVIILHSMNR